MMFTFYLAFGVALIALALGVGLLAWGLQNRGSGVLVAKIFGGIILVLALLGVLAMANTARQMLSQPMMMPMMGGASPAMMKEMHGKAQNGKPQNIKAGQNGNNH